MHTEGEAQKLWCPMARVPDYCNGAATAGNKAWRPHGSDPLSKACCIASKCAMWRWLPHVDNRHRVLVRKGTRERVSAGFTTNTEWVLENPDEPKPARRGHCGLAGKP